MSPSWSLFKVFAYEFFNVQSLSIAYFGDFFPPAYSAECLVPLTYLTWGWLLCACVAWVLPLQSKYSASCLWVLWPSFSAVFSPLPPLYSPPNCNRWRSILCPSDWWIEHLSEWNHTRNHFPVQLPEPSCGIPSVIPCLIGAQRCSWLAIL